MTWRDRVVCHVIDVARPRGVSRVVLEVIRYRNKPIKSREYRDVRTYDEVVGRKWTQKGGVAG